MRTYQNPFRSRASEQLRDTLNFLRNFGSGALDLLPEAIWDRPLIIRSASGGGKTTLMRMFTAESLLEAHARRDDLRELTDRLQRVGALDAQGPARFGFLLNLGRDYRTIANSGAPDDVASRLLLRLLDARIASGAVRAAMTLAGARYPEQASSVELRLRHDDERAVSASERLGGLTGDAIFASSRAAESEIVDLLDSLLPVDWSAASRGHAELYSLRLLSDADIFVAGVRLDAQPLLLLDDGHELSTSQRTAVLTALMDRDVTVARWYAERFEALNAEQVLQDDTSGRDYELLELERAAREFSTAGRRRFDRILREVGNLRAGRHLERYTHGPRDFFEYLEDPGAEVDASVLPEIRSRAFEVAGDNPTYTQWLEQADNGGPHERMVRIRAAQIVIERHLRRPQQQLFDSGGDVDVEPFLKSDIREAARLFLGREFSVPFYAGEDTLVALASQNVEQFLRVCGDLFDYMLGRITLGEAPVVSAARQQTLLRKTSEQFWRDLPARLPQAADVLKILQRITNIAVTDTYRPTAPYSPGVTGIAISMEDRSRLLDPEARRAIPGADRLLAALGVAISRHVLVAEPNYSVKNTRVMVLYLNRLLCPRPFLPLQRGGFRERGLAEVASWLTDDDPISEATLEQLFPA